MRFSRPDYSIRRAGLTLVELLVVLSILAVLSTVALRSVTDLATEARYDANVEQLDEIKEAILGDRDGFVGFVGDVGRLPVLVNDSSDAEFHLNELLQRPVNIEPFSIQTPAGDSSLRLPCGWRGPYLSLSANRDFLGDGFGRAFELSQPDGSQADSNGEVIGTITSRGFSGTIGGVDFEEDFSIEFEDNATTTVNWSQDISVEVTFDGDYVAVIAADIGNVVYDGNQEIVVRVYGAGDDTTTAGLTEAGKLVTIAQLDRGPADEAVPENFEFNTTDRIPYGQKIFRAYYVNVDDIDDIEDDLFSLTGSESLLGFSPPFIVNVDRFTNSIQLEIQEKP